MADELLTVQLTEYEARALQHSADLMSEIFGEHVRVEGDVPALESAAMKLAMALVLEGRPA